MKKTLFLLSSLCLIILTACNNTGGRQGTSNRGDQQGQSRETSADDTGRNVRDRSGQTLTSGDQPENEKDRMITQKVRQALMEDDSLSTNAKNIKIITVNAVVTLRGTVNNDREKNEIAKKARAINGVKSVDNQLETNPDTSGSGTRNDNMNR